METIKIISKQKNILFIDSDKILKRDIEDYLEHKEIKGKYGLNFIFAGNAREALKKAAEQKIDLIVLDIILPIINGYYLINTFKKEKIPVIVYTKLKSGQDLAKLAATEVDNIFLKELIKIEDLIEILSSEDTHKTELDKLIPELQNQIKTSMGEEGKIEFKMVQCPRCNMMLAPDSYFCNNCGQKIFKKQKQIKLKDKEIKQK
jgi:CheY-like chemotaxis protein